MPRTEHGRDCEWVSFMEGLHTLPLPAPLLSLLMGNSASQVSPSSSMKWGNIVTTPRVGGDGVRSLTPTARFPAHPAIE